MVRGGVVGIVGGDRFALARHHRRCGAPDAAGGKNDITLARHRGLARLGTAFRGASLAGRVRSEFVVVGVAVNGFVVCLSLQRL